MRLYIGARDYDDHFKLEKDVFGRIRFLGLRKCMTAMTIPTYGIATDSRDKYIWMSKSTCLEAMVR